MLKWTKLLGCVLIVLLLAPAAAQETGDLAGEVPVIDADNVGSLQPVARIEFPTAEGETGAVPFPVGWFALSPGGRYIAAFDRANQVHAWDDTGEPVAVLAPPAGDPDTVHRVVDAAFDRDEVHMAVVYTSGCVAVYHLPSQDLKQGCPPPLAAYQAVWLDERTLWIEALDTSGRTVVLRAALDEQPLDAIAFETRAFPAAAGEEPVVRIGRVEPPHVVTSSAEGQVTLWDMRQDEPLAQVDNGAGEPAVFGNIDPQAGALAWRDQRSEALYLLNFDSGTNRRIDDLAGQYVQWFFLGRHRDVILGVNLDFTPDIVAWDARTGARQVVGEYLPCTRPQPDMARLSRDGRTLAIGCDAGLELWRVAPD